jgi:hypothetical protein
MPCYQKKKPNVEWKNFGELGRKRKMERKTRRKREREKDKILLSTSSK